MNTAAETEMDEMLRALRKHPGYRPPPPEPPPATEKALKEVWHLWNLLPDDWTPETRINLLTCSKRSFSGLHAFYAAQRLGERRKELRRNKIKPVSAKFLKAWTGPLAERNRSALDLASWWHYFARQNYPVMARLRPTLVQRYLNFKDDDLPNSDDAVATWRTGRELIARKEFGRISLAEFWNLGEPTLWVVKLAQRRWHSYRAARTKARQHFLTLDVPGRLADYASPADAFWRIDKGLLAGPEAQELANQLNDAEKEMVRKPAKLYEFVSNNLTISQDIEGVLRRTHRTTPALLDNWGFMFRCACGLASKDDLQLTLPTFFPKLSLDEKLRFLRFIRAKPRRMKKNRLALLKIWLQDNAPVFSEFHWHTEAVLDMATAKFKDPDKKWIPQSPELLTQFCSRAKPKIVLGLHRARYQDKAAAFGQPYKSLLTEPPLLV